jgi:hypothetical protein
MQSLMAGNGFSISYLYPFVDIGFVGGPPWPVNAKEARAASAVVPFVEDDVICTVGNRIT